MTEQSARAQIVERRTYLRPTNKNGTEFETPAQAWQRVIDHQRWLWERAQGDALDADQEDELDELYQLFIDRKVTVSGRTRWLGGTDVAKEREASQFNCSFGEVQTVHDVVDTIWLLLQGCGVGFRGNVGVLNGFASPVELEIIRSQKGSSNRFGRQPYFRPILERSPEQPRVLQQAHGCLDNQGRRQRRGLGKIVRQNHGVQEVCQKTRDRLL